MGRKWQWQNWIKETLPDEITLKGATAWDRKSYNMISKLSSRYNIPVYYCSYMAGFVNNLDGQKRFKKVVTKSKKWKQNGLIIYESAMILKELTNGRIKILFPGISGIINSGDKK